MKAVIIAAGQGNRLLRKTYGIPKTLLPLGNDTLLLHILRGFAQNAIPDFVIVVGYQSKLITSYLERNRLFGYKIVFLQNHEWNRGNGISVLSAEKAVADEEFLLSMSDHIVPASAIGRVINCDRSENILLVDRRVDKIFDVNDATKVIVQKNKIKQIGKNLRNFNGIDCGIFRLNGRYFDSMRKQLTMGNESISSAIDGLIENDDMFAVFMEDHEDWIDIDTPQAYQYALSKFK
jgi:choline kinase